jgi:hypothetical protein
VTLGHRPKGEEFESLPQELRGDHWGVVYGRLPNLATVILVDVRGTRKHLQTSERTALNPNTKPISAEIGESCKEACDRYEAKCDWTQLEYFNTCRILERHFTCKKMGCMASDGPDLPALSVNDADASNGQCLVSLNTNEPGPQSCSLKTRHKARLCPCNLKETTTTFKYHRYDWQSYFSTLLDPLVLKAHPSLDDRFDNKHLGELPKADDSSSFGQFGYADNYKRISDEVGQENQQLQERSGDEGNYYAWFHNASFNPRRRDYMRVNNIYLEGLEPEAEGGAHVVKGLGTRWKYGEIEVWTNASIYVKRRGTQ